MRGERPADLWAVVVGEIAARASRAKASSGEREAAGELTKAIMALAKAGSWPLWGAFMKNAAKEVGRSKIAQGEVAPEIWRQLPLDMKIEMACGHALSSKIGKRSFERVVGEIGASSGQEREAAGMRLSLAAWGGFDAKIIGALKEAFPEEERGWLAKRLAQWGPELHLELAWRAARRAEWEKNHPASSGHADGALGRSGWERSFETLRASLEAKEIAIEAPKKAKAGKGARL